MSQHVKYETLSACPRIPLEGTLDLTYRCNNKCRHCWLRIPPDADERARELSFDEIVSIADQAGRMGCSSWSIFGGEPMIRPDFAEVFDYVTQHCKTYTLNTNGTLITPEIASLMKRRGTKLLAIYGATAKVHDNVTRTPGSFEAAMRGMSYLKEAGVGFTVQVVPMRMNYHQLDEMIELAESVSGRWRIGASWLYLSACGDDKRNEEIWRQRLDPTHVARLERPSVSEEDWMDAQSNGNHHQAVADDDRLFFRCAANGTKFHVDPYGSASFCSFVKDPRLRYDLRNGNFEECWDNFIPSVADNTRGGKEYLDNCGSCEAKSDCLWCPAYGYLEHRRSSAKVEYLCEVARAAREYKEDWRNRHRRYYNMAGITLQVEADLPITDETFHEKLRLFEAGEPGNDTIAIRHHFFLPRIEEHELGLLIYEKEPWAIFRKGDWWIYRMPADLKVPATQLAVFNLHHSSAIIYNNSKEAFRKGALDTLSLFTTDQIMIARVLADRQACYFHSSAVNLDGKGLMFVGSSEAGKSTVASMLSPHAQILCDERIVVRRWPDRFWIHGNWSHGELPIVSPDSAPLTAIFFLNKTSENRLEPIHNNAEIARSLLPCLIKPLETSDWWEKVLAVIDRIAAEVPCYTLHFDRSGKVVDLLTNLCDSNLKQ